MLVKQPLDFLAVSLQLAFQGLEQFDQGQRQPALGSGDRRTAAKRLRPLKDLEPLLVEFGAVEAVRVQELFPLPASRLLEQLRGGKLLHETPGGGGRPIIKGRQCRRIILL